MTGFLVMLVVHGGLAAIFLTMTAESAGIPISSEIVVPLGGYLAWQGLLPFFGVVTAASLGNLAGSMVAFGLARRYGAALVIDHGARFGLRQRHLDLSERFFRRFGLIAVFVGRLLPVVRTYISFPAGMSRMGWLSFAAVTLAGCIPWNFALAYAGLQLGQRYPLVEHYLGPVTLPAAAAVLILLLALYQLGRRSERANRSRSSATTGPSSENASRTPPRR
jgi:membrane protein DedA with SNARE-associated domain